MSCARARRRPWSRAALVCALLAALVVSAVGLCPCPSASVADHSCCRDEGLSVRAGECCANGGAVAAASVSIATPPALFAPPLLVAAPAPDGATRVPPPAHGVPAAPR